MWKGYKDRGKRQGPTVKREVRQLLDMISSIKAEVSEMLTKLEKK